MSDIRPKLAERIKWYRKRAGLSQRALADALKADKATVWRAEQGDSWPDYKTLEGMAAVFGVELEALFDWAESPAPTAREALAVIERELDARPYTREGHERVTPVTISVAENVTRDPLAARIAKIQDPAGRAALNLFLNGLEEELLAAKVAPQKKGKPPEKGK